MEKQKEEKIQGLPIIELKKKVKSTVNGIDRFTVDSLIKQLKNKGNISKGNFKDLIQKLIPILKNEPNILKASSPIFIVGDIHGQFYDLLTIFENHGMPPEKKYLFLGDYVDRGMFGVQVITLLFFLKLKYPEKILLLRGNHESHIIAAAHNFLNECKIKYNISIYNLVIELFECLPICCIVDKKFFGVHAGISPELTTLNELQKINRFQEVPPKGILCDLLWSDPTQEPLKKWTFNKMRSCSYFYSPEHAGTFLKANDLKLIIRGHEIEKEGFKYQECKKKKNKPTLTIFSAPNYCDKYKNLGAVGLLSEGQISVSNFRQVEHPFIFPKFENAFEWSIPLITNCATRMLLHSFSDKLHKKKYKKSKTAEEIKSEIYTMEKVELFKQFLNERANKTQKIFEESSQNGQFHQGCDFVSIKEQDNNEAFPAAQSENDILDRQEKESENKSQKSLFSLFFMAQKKSMKNIQSSPENQSKSRIFGPKIKDFVRIMPHQSVDQC